MPEISTTFPEYRFLDITSSLLKLLAAYISDAEKNAKLDCNLNRNDCIEKLLESKLLFFASKETGDPVYSNSAHANSERVFNLYFQNNKENDFFFTMYNNYTFVVINYTFV